MDNDFTGASLVLNNLGEPDNGFLADEKFYSDKKYVDIDLLNEILNK